MNTKNIVITGGTDGIGLAIVKNLLKENNKIFIIGNNSKKGDNVIKTLNSQNIEFYQCNLLERNEIEKLVKELSKLNKIDRLINNAGALFLKRDVNSRGIEKTFALNHLSYFHLSLSLLEKLELSNDGRIINVASNAHKRYDLDLNDLENKKDYNSWKAYCRSKLLNILFTYAFKSKINSKVTCNCLHPGFVNSNFGNNNKSLFRYAINILKQTLAISTNKGSQTAVYLCNSLEVSGISGKYFYKCKPKKSSDLSYDSNLANLVWKESLKYLEKK